MLSKILYELSILLCNLSCYSDLSIEMNQLLNKNIIEEIHSKNTFFSKWNYNLNYQIKNFKFKYDYSIIEQKSNLIKLKFNLIRSFDLKSSIRSYSIDEYILIIEYIGENLKIHYLILKEENPIIYEEILKFSLDNINKLNFNKNEYFWAEKLDILTSIQNNFINFKSNQSSINYKRYSKFNIDKARIYAEKYSLISNPEYKTFEGNGGDCTNFVSQIIHAGGINKTNTWKPYSNSWIRVEEFYSYLIYNNIGSKIPDGSPLSIGSIIQFYTPKLGRFFHTGFITYNIDNSDYLYCCHSYNKLNYPLSAIYPIIYPKLRAIRIN